MKRHSYFLIFPILLSLILASCATKKPARTQELVDKKGGQSGSIDSTPSNFVKEETTPVPKARIALVLGGAGIASFATIGILKRFEQEGFPIEVIVATGWPSLFALGNGFQRSVHDLEWFSMRLEAKDFFDSGLFDFKEDFLEHTKLLKVASEAFKKDDLRQASTPVILTATETVRRTQSQYSTGDWKPALMKAMSVPGIYRPYPPRSNRQWITSVKGLDVDVAKKRQVDVVVAVDMYEDYLRFQDPSVVDSSAKLFRRLYFSQLRTNIRLELAKASIATRIKLGRRPNDFSAKRQAILAGYEQATQIIKELRRTLGE